MPPVSKIALLPDEVRDELASRLKEQQFGRIVETSEWLRDMGHDVGKSAVGAFSLQLKKDMEHDDRRREKLLIRLECVRIAAAENPAHNVLARAQEFIDWIEGKQA